jgi:ABC-type proline/glycine betaine transport system ATPase subunit
VIDKGKIIESGEPYQLLSKTKNSFYKLVSETGDKFTDHLTKLSKEAKIKKENNNFYIFEDEDDKNMIWNQLIDTEIVLEEDLMELEDEKTNKKRKNKKK